MNDRRGTVRDGVFITAALLLVAGLVFFFAGYRGIGPLLWALAAVVGVVWLVRRGFFTSRR